MITTDMFIYRKEHIMNLSFWDFSLAFSALVAGAGLVPGLGTCHDFIAAAGARGAVLASSATAFCWRVSVVASDASVPGGV